MTDADRTRLSRYLRDLADRMGLKDWAIVVLDDPADDDNHAEVGCLPGRKLAEVKFDRDWHDQTPEVLRHTCCHELVHCHGEPVRAEVRRRLNKADFATFVMLQEYEIDGIADAWAPCLPLMLTSQPEETAEPKPKGGPKGEGTKKGCRR